MSSASDTQIVLPTAASPWWHDRVTRRFGIGWLLVVAPYLGLLVGRPPSESYRNVWTFAGLAIAVALACFVDWSRAPRGPERRFRALVGTAFLLWAASELAEHLLRDADAAARLTLRDTAFAVFGVLMCAAGMVQGDEGRSAEEIRLGRLHRAEVALLAVGLFVDLAVLPARLDPALAASSVPSAVYFVTLDLLMVGIFARRWRMSPSAAGRARFTALSVAACLFLLSDGLFLFGSLGWFPAEGPALLDLIWYLPHLAVVAGVRQAASRPHSTWARSGGARSVWAKTRLAPGFLYAALVPTVHLGAELAGGLSTRAPRMQHLFALFLTLLLSALAWIHQRRQRALWSAFRRELVAGARRRAAADKLEAIGRLAAGVAHDFNNLLTVVVGRAELMHARLESETARAEVARVLEISERATSLTAELLAVGERESGLREIVEIDRHLECRREELAARMGGKTEVVLDLEAAGARVEIDRSHLDRIVGNLAANAALSMAGGGRLTIATRRRQLESGWTRQLDEIQAGDYLSLEVRDDGVRLDDEALERVFEPFYRARQTAGGGLGLATVRGLVRQNGGQILARALPGRGTAFEIYFAEWS